jgi:hypothetical protein
MKKLILLPLLLFGACADNEFEPTPTIAQILSLSTPAHIVAQWPDSILIQAETLLPTPYTPGDYALVMQVEGPGLENAIQWQLFDDGDFYEIVLEAPGQLLHSGDNVPGDGVFSALITSDFTEGLGEFSLRADLYEGSQLLSQSFASLSRVVNSAPAIHTIQAPDSLQAAQGLDLSIILSDPDGSEDLAIVRLENHLSAREWDLTLSQDSTWALSLDASFAAGLLGTTRFYLHVEDRFAATALDSFDVDIENTPPQLDASAFQFWIFDLDDEVWNSFPVADTLRLLVPDVGSTNYYNMALPVFDARGQADLAQVEWGIAPASVAPENVTYYPMDDLGPVQSAFDFIANDGVWSGGFQLPGGDFDLHWSLHLRARDHVHQWAEAILWPMTLESQGTFSPRPPHGTTGAQSAAVATSHIVAPFSHLNDSPQGGLE